MRNKVIYYFLAAFLISILVVGVAGCQGKNVPVVPASQTPVPTKTLLSSSTRTIIGRGSQASLYKQIMSDAKWAQLKALKNGKVFIRPEDPFSWFDGPPGANQVIGLYWTVNKLYPDKTTNLDLKAKTKEFYDKFYHYQLTDDEVAVLLANPK